MTRKGIKDRLQEESDCSAWIERGERNPTLVSVYTVAHGLKMKLAELFKGLG